MNIFDSIDSFSTSTKTIVTIGTFDGVHLGHSKIISRLTNSARELHCQSVVLTFFPHPRMVLKDPDQISLLNTIEEKKDLLEQHGLENLIIHPFNEAFSELSAEDFVKNVLVDSLNIQKIILGHDHRFGKGRSAGMEDLVIFGKQYGFEVEQISVQELDQVSISSTKIRRALVEGNVSLANDFLGYNYFVTGTVVEGKMLGRTIGYPTANLKVEQDYKLIPAQGVYLTQCSIDGSTVYGMTNIGTNPTVGGIHQTIETYFLNYSEDLYGKKLKLEFLSRLRDEQKFSSVEDLKQQLQNDANQALTTLQSLGKLV